MAVVHLFKTRISLIMHLLCCFTFYSAFYQFQFKVEHVPGVCNAAADAISCNNISLFLSLVPQSQQVSISSPVVDLLMRS